MRPLRLRWRLWEQLPLWDEDSVRGLRVGKAWRQVEDGRWRVTCWLPTPPAEVSIDDVIRWESRPVVEVHSPDEEWVPMRWRRAMWRHMRLWPRSSAGVAGLAYYTDCQQLAQLRKLATELVKADDAGVLTTAAAIGELTIPRYRVGEW